MKRSISTVNDTFIQVKKLARKDDERPGLGIVINYSEASIGTILDTIKTLIFHKEVGIVLPYNRKDYVLSNFIYDVKDVGDSVLYDGAEWDETHS